MRRYLQSLCRVFAKPPTVKTSQPSKLPTASSNNLVSPLQAAEKEAEVITQINNVQLTDPPLVEKSEKNNVSQSTIDQIFCTKARSVYVPNNNRITVFGAGGVGLSTVFTLLAKGITNQVTIIDFNEKKLKGGLLDMQYGCFLNNAKILFGKDFSLAADSKICILTPPAVAPEDELDSDPAKCYAEIIRSAVPQLLKYSPDTLILIALEPVDVLSHLAWRVSGLPRRRVIGSGNNLFTATFRYLLACRLGLSPSSCSGYIIGENGESCVPVWSGVTVGGVKLRDLNPEIGAHNDPENWQEVHRQVLRSRQEVCELKHGCSWATGLSLADICSAILNDSNCIRPVSTYVKGEHSIKEDVFLSLPCVLGSAGVTDIIRQPLSTAEMLLLHRSADSVAEGQNAIRILQ